MSGTESFDSVINESFEIAKTKLQIAFEGKLFERLLSDLQAAHKREIRDMSRQQYDCGFRDGSQQQYHRGFEDGRHSMDAEHRVIAMRLRGLRFDGGSHENLSRIAYAIYPCATGWTCESADSLRDKLVDLMGGASDDTSIGAGGGACDAAGSDCAGEHEEVEHGGAAHDCAADSRGGTGSELVHLDGLVAYDALDNERHKAIAKLRKCDGGYTLEWDNIYEIFDALGVDYVGMAMAEVYENVRDRLIHLLGGDQPSGIDAMREMDAESDTDGTCPNDDITSSITDELRGYVQDNECEHIVLLSMPPQDEYRLTENGTRLLDIADHIDAAVKHEREADRLRIEKLEKQRDHWKVIADTYSNAIDEAIQRIKSLGQE